MLISRYMPLNQLEDMLVNGLYIPNMSTFDDPWEGIFHYIAEAVKEKSEAISLNKALGRNTKIYSNGVKQGPDPIPDIPKIHPNIKLGKTWMFVGCWHISSEECMAMWKLYGKYKNSICIEVETDKLSQVATEYFDKDQKTLLQIAEVKYMNPLQAAPFDLKPITYLFPKDKQYKENFAFNIVRNNCFSKHNAYSYEKELRLLIDKFSFSDETSIRECPFNNIRLKLEKDFFKSIVLSPYCNKNTFKKVNAILNRYNFNAEVRVSCLAMN